MMVTTTTLDILAMTIKDWKIEKLDTGTKENLYINPEEPYIHEMDDFLNVRTKACKEISQIHC